MDIVLEAADVRKDYEDFSLRGVSLAVRRGCIGGIFGPNGAGKSTLLKMLAGQAPTRLGTVRVFGAGYAAAEQSLKNRIGYVPQEPVFYQDKTVTWHARFVAPYFAHWNGSTFYGLLETFRVNHLKKVKHLSGGQKKLLSLALALSHGADLLILDEPTAGLDVVHRRALLDRLRAFVADGDKTVVVASHITDGLDEIAEDIWFLLDGRVVLEADADELSTRWKWIHYKDGAVGHGVEERLTNLTRQPFGSRGLTSDFPDVREALARALDAGDARVANASLEDILLSFIKGA
ncbi:MAG: ATP-binding cassette domain-containing protein [Bacteroidales bacterium]